MLSLYCQVANLVSRTQAKLACLLNRHVPYRKRANWDGTAYIGRCRDCGRPIRRIRRRKWRKRPLDQPSSTAG